MSERDEDGVILWSAPEPFPAVSQKPRRGIRVTSAAAVALGLALGGGAVAGATSTTTSPTSSSAGSPEDHPSMGGPPAATGTVKSVGTDTFTVTAQDGTTATVNVSSTTTYRDHGVNSPSLANVTVGEHVAVFGTDTSNGVTATSVAIGDPPGGGRVGPGDGPGGGHGTPPAGTPGDAG